MKFIRYVGNEQCADNIYQSAIAGGDDIVVDWVSSRPNSTVTINLNDKPMAPEFSDTLLDFTDLGILVYLADEMVSRERAGDYWTRHIQCLFPVAEPENWGRYDSLLRDTLEVLSGDLWSFDWAPLNTSRPVSCHRKSLPREFDTVCLFSGGTDSLLGAHKLLSEGRKVILVGHQSEGETSSAQKDLAHQLGIRFPGKTCLVQCRASRSARNSPTFSLAKKVERSHRPRSFLFLTLGVGIAAQAGITDVYMPENGLMVLNIPLQKSRLGSLSTRTAHPSYITNFSTFAQNIAGFQGNIQNPFLTQSKTDMLQNLGLNMRPLVLRTISCARPSRYKDKGVRHCGYCVPCIHRRIAFMEAEIDSANDYAFDVFRRLQELDADKQHDFRASVGFASRLASASETHLQAQVLCHGHFPASVGLKIGGVETTDYTPWTEMLKRWSTDFVDKVGGAASASTRRSVGLWNRKEEDGSE